MALTQPCFINLTPDQQNFNIYEQLSQIAGFEIPAYDEIDITYYGSTNNIETVVYSNGGSPVATLTLTYSVQPPTSNDANLVNVVVNSGGAPVDTTIYDSTGNILFTVNGNIPEFWKQGQGIAGYVDIGTSATSIGGYGFQNNQLTSVTIPNFVTSIGNYAFNSNLLASVTIPNSVTNIGSGVFQNNQLTSVTIPNSVTSIGSWAFGYNQLASVTIPNSMTSIGDYAFSHNQLTSVTIPNSVTSIGFYAFQNNQLTSVNIPNSVTSIGSGAFRYNSNLATFNCYTTQTAFVGSNALYNTASPLTIHARATDATWTIGTGLSFQGNSDVTVIKDL